MMDVNMLLESIRESLHQIGVFLPRLLLAIVIVVIGWLLAKAVRFAVVRALRAINLNIVTEKAGIHSGQWAVAAGWFDYDNDARLDLMVVHYSSTPMQDRFCGNREKGIRIYCHPKYFDPLPPSLYHNRGDGTFEDVSKKSGIAQQAGRGMSIAFADYALGKLSDHLWNRSRPTRAEIDRIVDFCLAAVSANGADGANPRSTRRQRA